MSFFSWFCAAECTRGTRMNFLQWNFQSVDSDLKLLWKITSKKSYGKHQNWWLGQHVYSTTTIFKLKAIFAEVNYITQKLKVNVMLEICKINSFFFKPKCFVVSYMYDLWPHIVTIRSDIFGRESMSNFAQSYKIENPVGFITNQPNFP